MVAHYNYGAGGHRTDIDNMKMHVGSSETGEEKDIGGHMCKEGLCLGSRLCEKSSEQKGRLSKDCSCREVL